MEILITLSPLIYVKKLTNEMNKLFISLVSFSVGDMWGKNKISIEINNKNIENLMHKSRELEKEKFIESLKAAVSPIYHIALNQGFEIWDN